MIRAKVLGGARIAARPAARHAARALGARRCPLLASSHPRRWASDGAEKQHLRLLGLRMDSVKDARLTEDDLRAKLREANFLRIELDEGS